jgi:hypothetical protein
MQQRSLAARTIRSRRVSSVRWDGCVIVTALRTLPARQAYLDGELCGVPFDRTGPAPSP